MRGFVGAYPWDDGQIDWEQAVRVELQRVGGHKWDQIVRLGPELLLVGLGLHKVQIVDDLLPLTAHVFSAREQRPELDSVQEQHAAGGQRVDLRPGLAEAGLDVVQHVVQLYGDADERWQKGEDRLLAVTVVDLDGQILQMFDHLADVLDCVGRADRSDLDRAEGGDAVQLLVVGMMGLVVVGKLGHVRQVHRLELELLEAVGEVAAEEIIKITL